MKIKSVNLIPLVIAGTLIFLALLLHIASRKLAEYPRGPDTLLTEQLESITYDARAKLGAAFADQHSMAKNLATVFIDDTSVEQVNRGELARYFPAATNDAVLAQLRFRPPWPRFLYGQIVRELAAQGATVVGFDILFSELDELNPIRNVPDAERGSITADEFFAQQIERAGNVILATEGNLMPAPLFLTNAQDVASIAAVEDYGVIRRVKAFNQKRVWHPLLLDLVKKLGLDLDNADVSQKGKVVIPLEKYAANLRPEPLIVPLNPNGTMKLLADGGLDVGDDPADEGPATEFPFTVERVWNLGLVLAARALSLDLERPEFQEGKIILRGPGEVRRVIPVDSSGFFNIDWSLRFEDLKSGRTPVYFGQVQEVLINDQGRQTGKKDLNDTFTNKIVVIGSIATGNNVSDFGSTPLEHQTPLVTKHLNIANSLLTGRFVQRLSLPAEVAIIALLGIASAVVTWRTRVVMASITAGALCVGYVLVATWLYLDWRIWAPVVMPLGGGLILPHFGLVTYRVIFEQKEQRRVRGIFSKIVSPDVVQELLSAETLSLGGARRKITVYFADVRGFTEFTDASQAAAEEYARVNNLPPAEAEAYIDAEAAKTLATVNLYLATIADRVKKHRGTLDKYIGDCVMAFWGAPTPNEQHAICCVRAAVDAQRAIYQLNQDRLAENEMRKRENAARQSAGKPPLPLLPVLSLGTGINTGYSVVGLMGSDSTILNYTVFGAEVNLASRLEGVSGRGRIIISEASYHEIKRDEPELAAACIQLPPAVVKGFRQPVKIYEVPWKVLLQFPADAATVPKAAAAEGASMSVAG